MRQSFLTVLTSAGVLLAASAVQAQHSYLPATEIGGSGKIETFVGQLPDKVVANTFSSELANDVWRAGGPSAFLKDSGDGDIPAGFDTLSANTDLSITVPVLSHDQFSATGNLLYWDMSGGTPNFGPAPANTTIEIGREENSVVTNVGTLDGSGTPVMYVEDTSNATGGRSGHFHMRYDVVGDGVSAANEAPNGIYLLGNIVSMVGFDDSELVLIPLLKSGFDPVDEQAQFLADVAIRDSAATFLANNVVPEPTTGLIVAAAGALFMLPKRKGFGKKTA